VNNYAQIIDNTVVNVIVADADFVAQSDLDYVLLSRGGIGWTYDQQANQFVAPQPFESWTLDANNDWQSPKPKLDGTYYWNERQQEWIAHEPKTN
jgi:hypothetical protein